jgi:hypothetical protein
MEECSEVTQICAKILRHGYESYHPLEPEISNRRLLEYEISDLFAVLALAVSEKDINPSNLNVVEALKKKSRYLHYNKI